MGRHKVLDDAKKREFCALLSGGMSLAKAAGHVQCGRKTVYREMDADPDFAERVRRARMLVDLTPREAMRRFASKYWRAAAWMLDREREEKKERDARRAAAVGERFSRADLDLLADGIKQLLKPLALDPFEGPYAAHKVDEMFRRATPGAKKPPEQPKRQAPPVWESIRYLERRAAERSAAAAADEADAPYATDPPT